MNIAVAQCIKPPVAFDFVVTTEHLIEAASKWISVFSPLFHVCPEALSIFSHNWGILTAPVMYSVDNVGLMREKAWVCCSKLNWEHFCKVEIDNPGVSQQVAKQSCIDSTGRTERRYDEGLQQYYDKTCHHAPTRKAPHSSPR